MLFPESHDRPEFKSWLVRTIEPMCDADPEVMSDYIVALLKHDATMSEGEWKEFIARELHDFLEEKSRPFVDLLFTTLATKSFLPLPTPLPVHAPALAQPSKPIPTGPAAIVSSYRPEAFVPTGPSAQQHQQPLAGPSTLPPNGHLQGHGNDANGAVNNGDETMGAAVGPSGRPKCRDYHERGFCMRGVNCPYEHSDDVIIPTPEMMFGQFPFMPSMAEGGRGRGGRGGRGGDRGGRGRGGGPGGGGPGGREPKMPPSDEFMGDTKPPRDRNGNTLVITDIPPQHLTVQGIREYFSQFGEVTNVAVEGRSARALVSFTSNFQAFQAWKSDAAVFGSRHVKVLWHRPRPGQGGAGMEQLERSAALVANMKAMESGANLQSGAVQYSGPEQRLAATLKELEEKERRGKKETLMAEQKVLLKRAGDGTKEEKMEILRRVKAINKEMEELDKPPAPPVEGEGDVDMAEGQEGEGKGKDELMRLSAQLTALRDKASNLGIHPAAAARYSPYAARGRGRGRGGAGGRGGRGGGAVRGPMRLDNRTRAILLSGEALSDDGAKSALRAYYESTGGVLEEVDGGLKVAYPNQDMAEKVMAVGASELPDLSGKFTAGWYNPSSAPPVTSHEVEMVEEAQRGERDEEE